MDRLRILWFNWRCIKHPLAGGAEVYTHEVARRLSKLGHEVVLVASRPRSLPRDEYIDGYRVLRAGDKYTVYLESRRVYKQLRGSGWRPDIVVDEVNTIPFLAPTYVSEPVVMLIHQLCRECWSYAVHPLIQGAGWWLERRFHRLYAGYVREGRVASVVTVSPSTRRDLEELGYPRDRVFIVYNGLDWGIYGDCFKREARRDSLAVYVGRISSYKRLSDLLEAWRMIEAEGGGIGLHIAGRADPRYLRKLIKLARGLGLRSVEFSQNITVEEKKALLSRARVLVYPSIREGWGQTVIEAAACGTPSIAYDVPGLRDSVRHMETGILVQPGNIVELANAVRKLVSSDEEWSRLSLKAYEYSKGFNWDSTAREFLKILENSI